MANPDQIKHDQPPESDQGQTASSRPNLGPIIEAVALLRESCQTMRLLLDRMESSAAAHLELLDALMTTRDGIRWWEQLTQDDGGGD